MKKQVEKNQIGADFYNEIKKEYESRYGSVNESKNTEGDREVQRYLNDIRNDLFERAGDQEDIVSDEDYADIDVEQRVYELENEASYSNEQMQADIINKLSRFDLIGNKEEINDTTTTLSTNDPVISKLQKELQSTENSTRQYVIANLISDYIKRPSLQNSISFVTRKYYPEEESSLKERKVILKVNLKSLFMPKDAKQRMIKIAGQRYKKHLDDIILTSDKLPNKSANKFLLKRQFQTMLHEALKGSINYVSLDQNIWANEQDLQNPSFILDQSPEQHKFFQFGLDWFEN